MIPVDPVRPNVSRGVVIVRQEQQASIVRAPIAGLLTWLVPGLGHIFLGHRGRGLVLLVAVTATFWSGVAIGGVTSTVDPREHRLWFFAQVCTGGNTGVAYALNRAVRSTWTPGETHAGSHWVSAEVAVHYTGIAGLLNLLVILDAIVRADRRPQLAGRRGRRGVA